MVDFICIGLLKLQGQGAESKITKWKSIAHSGTRTHKPWIVFLGWNMHVAASQYYDECWQCWDQTVEEEDRNEIQYSFFRNYVKWTEMSTHLCQNRIRTLQRSVNTKITLLVANEMLGWRRCWKLKTENHFIILISKWLFFFNI